MVKHSQIQDTSQIDTGQVPCGACRSCFGWFTPFVYSQVAQEALEKAHSLENTEEKGDFKEVTLKPDIVDF